MKSMIICGLKLDCGAGPAPMLSDKKAGSMNILANLVTHIAKACTLLLVLTLGFLGGNIAYSPLDWPNSAFADKGKDDDDLDDRMEDRIAEEAEKRLAKEMEDRLKESAKAQERMEKALEDRIERQLKAEEDLQKALEDNVEGQVASQEDIDEAFEDYLEALAKAQEDFDEDVADTEEELAEAEEEYLEELADLEDDLEDDNRDNRREEVNSVSQAAADFVYEEILDAAGNRTINAEVMVLVSPEEVSEFTASGIQIREQEILSELGLILVKLNLGEDDSIATIEQALNDDFETASVDYNHLYQLDSDANQNNSYPIPALQLANKLGVQKALDTPLVIGMVDSAIKSNHDCFKDGAVSQQQFIPSGTTPIYGHGTAVASILVGDQTCATPGLLTNASIKNASVFFTMPNGSTVASAENMLRALNWLAEIEVPIINMSFSGPHNSLVRRVIQQLRSRGTIIVAAVGNDGPVSAPRYPAGYPEVIAVTAVNSNNQIYHRAVQGKHITFAAYGINVKVASENGSMSRSGTSIAAPFATSILAHGLLTNKKPELIQVFQNHSVDLGDIGHDPVFGYGLIQTVSQKILSK